MNNICISRNVFVSFPFILFHTNYLSINANNFAARFNNKMLKKNKSTRNKKLCTSLTFSINFCSLDSNDSRNQTFIYVRTSVDASKSFPPTQKIIQHSAHNLMKACTRALYRARNSNWSTPYLQFKDSTQKLEILSPVAPLLLFTLKHFAASVWHPQIIKVKSICHFTWVNTSIEIRQRWKLAVTQDQTRPTAVKVQWRLNVMTKDNVKFSSWRRKRSHHQQSCGCSFKAAGATFQFSNV